MNIVELAKDKAIEVLESCSTSHGLYASGGRHGYTSVWARDSMISMIGAATATPEFKKVFAASLSTLAQHQSQAGQIPNDVDLYDPVEGKRVTFATIDSSLWFVLGEYFYRKKFGDEIWTKHKKNIAAAMNWAWMQDAGEDSMPEQLPTSDWQDCFPHKYGHTINTQALYYACLRAIGASGNLKLFKRFVPQVNKYLWDGSLGYFLPWHWKDHGKYREKETWFDSLGNMLAIVFGLATKKQAASILDFVAAKRINKPYPLKAIFPPVNRGSKEWHDYFSDSLAGRPNNYLNGGIWPFIGGFYVCALVEAGRFGEAKHELELLCRANSLGKKYEWDFNEWIHPKTGRPEGGRHQAWSAGGCLLAYTAVESRRNPLKA